MRKVTSLPYKVQEDENVWITMSDGVRLAGRIWRPISSDEEPVPAILEFIPYRKRDLTAVRDSIHHPYMAGHGYACIRVDIRGTGDSEGVLTDEYLEQELRDAEEVLAWLAAQRWSNGRAGMMGISWGGFNALQVAARRPPSLERDRHPLLHRRPVRRRRPLHGRMPAQRQPLVGVDDVRLHLLPAGPGVVGERWREMWLQRLERSGLWLETGSGTNAATSTGATRRSGRTTPVRVRCWPRAAGRTATPTPSRGCWATWTYRARG